MGGSGPGGPALNSPLRGVPLERFRIRVKVQFYLYYLVVHAEFNSVDLMRRLCNVWNKLKSWKELNSSEMSYPSRNNLRRILRFKKLTCLPCAQWKVFMNNISPVRLQMNPVRDGCQPILWSYMFSKLKGTMHIFVLNDTDLDFPMSAWTPGFLFTFPVFHLYRRAPWLACLSTIVIAKQQIKCKIKPIIAILCAHDTTPGWLDNILILDKILSTNVGLIL